MKSFDVQLDDINWSVRRIEASRHSTEKHILNTNQGEKGETKDIHTRNDELVPAGAPNIMQCRPEFTYTHRSKDVILCVYILILAFLITPMFMTEHRTMLPISARRKHIRIAFAVLFGTQTPYFSTRWHRGPTNIHMLFLHNTAILCVLIAYERNADLLGVLTLVIACIYVHIAHICYREKQQTRFAVKLTCCFIAVLSHGLMTITAFSYGFSPTRRPDSWYTLTGLLLILDVFAYFWLVYTIPSCSPT